MADARALLGILECAVLIFRSSDRHGFNVVIYISASRSYSNQVKSEMKRCCCWSEE